LSPQALQQKARERAFALLARRDYSRKELAVKLAQRFEAAIIEPLLDSLEAKGWQSDLRFAQSFYRESIRLGRGPIRIDYELKQKGMDADVFQALKDWLEEGQDLQIDWVEQAQAVYLRKYGECPCLEPKEVQKRVRFMQSRGFAYEHYRHLF
jgi:regulatory protein